MRSRILCALLCAACLTMTGCAKQPNFFEELASCPDIKTGEVKIGVETSGEVGTVDVDLNAIVVSMDTVSLDILAKGEISLGVDTEQIESAELTGVEMEIPESIPLNLVGNALLAGDKAYVSKELIVSIADMMGMGSELATVFDSKEATHVVTTVTDVTPKPDADTITTYNSISKDAVALLKEIFTTDNKEFFTVYKEMPAIVINAENAELFETRVKTVLEAKFDTFVAATLEKIKTVVTEEEYASIEAQFAGITYDTIADKLTGIKDSIIETGIEVYAAVDVTNDKANGVKLLVEIKTTDNTLIFSMDIIEGTPSLKIPEKVITEEEFFAMPTPETPIDY